MQTENFWHYFCGLKDQVPYLNRKLNKVSKEKLHPCFLDWLGFGDLCLLLRFQKNWTETSNLRIFRASSHSNWRNWYPGQFYFHVIFVMLTWRWNESWSTWAFLTPTCLTSFRISTYYLGYWYSSVFVTWKSSLQKSMELIYTKKCKIQFSRIIRIFSQFQRWPLKEFYFTVILPRR